MTHADRPFARLVLSDCADLALDRWLDLAEATLIQRDGAGVPRRIGAKGAVLGGTHGIRLRPEARGEHAPSVYIEVVGRGTPDPDDPVAARLLSDIVDAALGCVACERIEWDKPGVLISAREFATLRDLSGFTTPHHSRNADKPSGSWFAVARNRARRTRAACQGALIKLREIGRRRAPLMAAAPVLGLAVALSLTQGVGSMATLILP